MQRSAASVTGEAESETKTFSSFRYWRTDITEVWVSGLKADLMPSSQAMGAPGTSGLVAEPCVREPEQAARSAAVNAMAGSFNAQVDFWLDMIVIFQKVNPANLQQRIHQSNGTASFSEDALSARWLPPRTTQRAPKCAGHDFVRRILRLKTPAWFLSVP